MAAEKLRPDHPAWAVVPLFYSAMHILHSRFVLDGFVPTECKHPGKHKTYRNGDVVHWGTTDVVVKFYPAKISRAYRSLYDGGYATRYKSPPQGPCDRLWDDYKIIGTLLD